MLIRPTREFLDDMGKVGPANVLDVEDVKGGDLIRRGLAVDVTKETHRVSFQSGFNWPVSSNITIHYKAGRDYGVTKECAAAAVSAGKATLLGGGAPAVLPPPKGPKVDQAGRGRLHAPLYIVIPAYKEHYVNYATKYVIPSLKVALDHRGCAVKPHFLVHTDMPARFEKALEGFPVTMKVVPSESGFKGLSAAHRDAIASAPVGAIVTLLNAGIAVAGRHPQELAFRDGAFRPRRDDGGIKIAH